MQTTRIVEQEGAVSSLHPRLTIDVHFTPAGSGALARDVRSGLESENKSLPPKYFYDDRGSELFDQICDTPEYYPTRTEQALLEEVSDDIIRTTRPSDIVEFGSGAARKTRCLLDAAERARMRARYVPFDVSEGMLRQSSEDLLDEYPWLEIHGVVGDYEQHISRIPDGPRRLLLFIGSTIGNLEHDDAVEFLRSIASEMDHDDRFLLGTDLVKDHGVLTAAYNDTEGVTEEFNKNVLRVINRELGGEFELDSFDHVAFFEPTKSRVEMHLRSKSDQAVRIAELDLTVQFEEGETIHTEISRKFTRKTLTKTLAEAGLELLDWYTPENEYFAISVSKRMA